MITLPSYAYKGKVGLHTNYRLKPVVNLLIEIRTAHWTNQPLPSRGTPLSMTSTLEPLFRKSSKFLQVGNVVLLFLLILLFLFLFLFLILFILLTDSILIKLTPRIKFNIILKQND